jgi:hypothetical protein
MKFATIALLVSASSAITIRQMKSASAACTAAQTTAGKVNGTDGNCVLAAAACTAAQTTAGKVNGTDGNCVLAGAACTAAQTTAGKVNDTHGNCVVWITNHQGWLIFWSYIISDKAIMKEEILYMHSCIILYYLSTYI